MKKTCIKPCNPTWPPAYTVRRHARARKITLRLDAQGAVHITTPHGYDQRHIPALLEQSRPQIEQALRRFASQAEEQPGWPEHIDLHALGESWRLETRARGDLRGVRLTTTGPNQLRLEGLIEEQDRCNALLRGWLITRAREHLVPLLAQLSRKLGYSYRRVQIRAQRSRWGSCSSSGTISLNAKLVLLPPDLVHHVLVHELCHTVQPNHSAAFWELVARHDPDYRRQRPRLRQAATDLPAWIRH